MPAAALVTLVVATALDLGLAAAGGYALRTDAALLVVLDASVLALIVTPALAVLRASERLLPRTAVSVRNRPRTTMFLAAWLPVGLYRWWWPPTPLATVASLAGLGGLVALCLLEPRRVVSAAEHLALSVAACLVICFAVALPSPGRSMLHGAAPRGVGASAQAPSLLLVVLDTLRADHLGVYGYARPTSPWLDRFARRATVFEHALSASSWTLPAHASLFTGLYPRAHGADFAGGGDGSVSLAELGRDSNVARVRPLAPGAVTLAELAQKAGFDTGAVCGNYSYLYHAFGLAQGFDTYVDPPGLRWQWRPVGLSLGLLSGSWRYRRLLESNERRYLLAGEVTSLALRWLEPRRDRRFFLFLNYMDAHSPYLPPGSCARLFPAASARQEVDFSAIRERRRSILPRERQVLIDAYDGEIRYLDDNLAKLFAQLEAWGLLDRMVVVILADHGESLGEHHQLQHANGVYEQEVRIPLIVRMPGQRVGRRVRRLVDIVDVLPTVADALGLDRPSDLQGSSLFEARRRYPIVAHRERCAAHTWISREFDWSHDAIYLDPWKLIVRSRGEMELYDIRRDPGELANLAPQAPSLVARLRRDLRRFRGAVRPRFDLGAPPLGREARERLRALGYLRGPRLPRAAELDCGESGFQGEPVVSRAYGACLADPEAQLGEPRRQ